MFFELRQFLESVLLVCFKRRKKMKSNSLKASKMVANHKTLSSLRIFSSSGSVQFRSSTICAGDGFPKYSACTSLEFAEYLLNRSKERSSNPVQCLHLLSCGAKTLKKQAWTTSAIAFRIQFPFHYLQELSIERNKKKRPEENELITSNSVRGSNEKDDLCFDGEGDTKAREREGNQQRSDTNSRHSCPSTAGAFGGNALQSSFDGNRDEDEDDENRQKRKLTSTPFRGHYIESNDDDDTAAEDYNAINDKKDIDDSNVAKDCLESGNDNTCTDEVSQFYRGNDIACDIVDECHLKSVVDYYCNGDGDYVNAVNDDNNEVVSADELHDDDSLPDDDIDDVKAGNADMYNVDGVEHDGDGSENDGDGSEHDGDGSEHDGDGSEHDGDGSEHDGDGSEEIQEENVNNVEGGCGINSHHPHDGNMEGNNYAHLAEMTDQCQVLQNSSIRSMKLGSITIEEFTENPCHHMKMLLKHSQKCRVHGGCEQCHCIPAVIIYHARHCENERCILKCRLTNEHFKDEPQTNNLGYHQCNHDKVIFEEYLDASSHNAAERHKMPIAHQENKEILHRFIEILSFSGSSSGSLPNNSNEFSRSTVSRDLYRQTEIPSPELFYLQRPASVKLLYQLNENYLGVQEGRYDEGFEWANVTYLGQGSFGKCYLNIDLKTKKHFATKKIPFSKYDPNELVIWSAVNGNVKILELLGAVQVDKFVIFFMEFMEEKSLAHLLVYQENGCLNEECALYILREVLEGVTFLHSKSIIHCDIKGENVFVNSLITKVKLGDFGSANQLHSSGYIKINVLKATVYFMAPEACRSEPISFSVDIWSCACLMVQMLTGKPPFYDFTGSVLYKVGTLKEPPPLPPACTEVVKDMLKDMFAVNPCERPSAIKLVTHYKALSEC